MTMELYHYKILDFSSKQKHNIRDLYVFIFIYLYIFIMNMSRINNKIVNAESYKI